MFVHSEAFYGFVGTVVPAQASQHAFAQSSFTLYGIVDTKSPLSSTAMRTMTARS